MADGILLVNIRNLYSQGGIPVKRTIGRNNRREIFEFFNIGLRISQDLGKRRVPFEESDSLVFRWSLVSTAKRCNSIGDEYSFGLVNDRNLENALKTGVFYQFASAASYTI